MSLCCTDRDLSLVLNQARSDLCLVLSDLFLVDDNLFKSRAAFETKNQKFSKPLLKQKKSFFSRIVSPKDCFMLGYASLILLQPYKSHINPNLLRRPFSLMMFHILRFDSIEFSVCNGVLAPITIGSIKSNDLVCFTVPLFLYRCAVSH